MFRLPTRFGIVDREVRPERDLRDVGDPGPAQPVVEVGRLEVDAELRSTIIAVHRAGIDDNGLLAGDQAGVPGVAIESEDQAGLTDDVDELLEDVRNTVIPHRHAEEVVVGRREPLEGPVHCTAAQAAACSPLGSCPAKIDIFAPAAAAPNGGSVPSHKSQCSIVISGCTSENVSTNVAAIASDSDAVPLGDADRCNSFDMATSTSLAQSMCVRTLSLCVCAHKC